MKAMKDPLYRAACRIHRKLEAPRESQQDLIEQQLGHFSDICRDAGRCASHRAIALVRGWQYVAGRSRTQLIDRAWQLYQITREMSTTLNQPARPRISSLGLLWAELRQLKREFQQVQIDAEENNTIRVQTDPIELEGVELGPFAIVLRLNRLASRRDSSCFECVALDPHPAERNSSITHPHVMDGSLCAGDAAAPISHALADGRICDAFLLVRAVLNTYNPGSPYARLDEWEGVTCPDCEATVGHDDLRRCPDCGRVICDECMSGCDICERFVCRSCQEQDEESDRWCCPACRRHCTSCDRVVDIESFDEDSGLCPQCLAEQTEVEPDEGELATAEEVGNPNAGPPAPTALTLVCQCNSSPSYPDHVYAVIELSADQAATLLELRSALGSVLPLLPEGAPPVIEVRDTRPMYVTAFHGEYEEAYLDHDLTAWHTAAVDPAHGETEVLVDGERMLITPDGLRWRVNPSEDGYQLIETATLGWTQLESVAARQCPFFSV